MTPHETEACSALANALALHGGTVVGDMYPVADDEGVVDIVASAVFGGETERVFCTAWKNRAGVWVVDYWCVAD